MGIFTINRKPKAENVLQRQVIQYLERELEASVIKLVTTNRSGWPDLFVAFSNGICTFIETKCEGNHRLRRNQLIRIHELGSKGLQTILIGREITIFYPYALPKSIIENSKYWDHPTIEGKVMGQFQNIILIPDDIPWAELLSYYAWRGDNHGA